jgi:hypothetical protein
MIRAMDHFMNPNVMMSWMMAPMNPRSMQPMSNMMNMGNNFAPVPAASNATAVPAN